MSSVGLTKLVYAILSQNGHGSHSYIPNLSQVRLLITFTSNPQLMIVLGTSFPLIIIVTIRLFSSITFVPSRKFQK